MPCDHDVVAENMVSISADWVRVPSIQERVLLSRCPVAHSSAVKEKITMGLR